MDSSGGFGDDDAQPLRILLVEDNSSDALLVKEQLRATRAIVVARHVAGLETAMEAARTEPFDAILLDLGLPDGNGLDTVRRALAGAPRLPIVVFTGMEDDQLGLEAVRLGAQDYLVKGRTDPEMMARAICYSVWRKRSIEEREQLIRQLQEALLTVRKLSGLLPICASCKKIRDDGGAWHPLEEYIHEHSEADFSHSLCPLCIQRLYPELTQTHPPEPTR